MIKKATSKEVKDFHDSDDVDSGSLAHHHTLGTKVNQAARGSDFKALSISVEEINAIVTGLVNAQMPVGHIIMIYGAAPSNYLLCDGAVFSGVTYPALAALLGGTNTPDLKDRLPVGASGTKALGSTGGSDTKVLTIGNMPTIPVRWAADVTVGSTNRRIADINGITGGGGTAANIGSSDPVNVQNKYLALNFAIKAK